MIILTSHHLLSHLPPTPLGPSLLTNMSPSYSQDFVLFWYDPVSLWSIAYTNMVGGGLLFTRSWASYLWLLIWLPLPQKPLIGNSSGTPAPDSLQSMMEWWWGPVSCTSLVKTCTQWPTAIVSSLQQLCMSRRQSPASAGSFVPSIPSSTMSSELWRESYIDVPQTFTL